MMVKWYENDKISLQLKYKSLTKDHIINNTFRSLFTQIFYKMGQKSDIYEQILLWRL